MNGGYLRYGGELPAGSDPVVPTPWTLPAGVLAFSHGRAALSWLHLARGPFASALICAYTCPSVPAHLRGLGLAVDHYDVAAGDIAERAAALPPPVLVLLPALLGAAPAPPPCLDDGAAVVVIDAAQTAFGAMELPVPPGGAVLCCPRKTTALGDGACLRVDRLTPAEAEAVARLPDAAVPARLKQAARRLLARCDQALEAEALRLIAASEAEWPAEPHRMTDEALAALRCLDPRAHAERRRANHARLSQRLSAAVSLVPVAGGVPFCLALLDDDPPGLLARLRQRRVFATRLWPDAEHDPDRHPVAHRLAGQLVALPVDQRYSPADMDRLADLVRACL